MNNEIYEAIFINMEYVRLSGQQCFADIAAGATRPSVLFRPSIQIDGDKWCALYGENLQDGVAGFGDTPELAMLDFDKNWNEKLMVK